VTFQVDVFWVVTPCGVSEDVAATVFRVKGEVTLVSYHNTILHHNPEDPYLK
jgi:hypothetical protein